MVVNHTDELLLLLLSRKLAIQQQVAGLQVIGLLCQLVDRVAPVQQYSLATIYIGNLGLTGGRGHKAGVVSEHAFRGQAADINHVRAQRAGVNRQVNGLVDAVNIEGGFLVAHVWS